MEKVKRVRQPKFKQIVVGSVGIYPEDLPIFEKLMASEHGVSAAFREVVHRYCIDERVRLRGLARAEQAKRSVADPSEY